MKSTEGTSKRRDKAKYLNAKADVDAAIKKHGFDAVRWVINKRTEENRLRKELAAERKRLNDRISEIQKKLKR